MNVIVASRKDDFRRHLSSILRRAGHQVADAGQSGQLLRGVLNGTFDLIILDVDLSGMDGVESLSVLKRIRPRVPIVMFSEEVSSDLSLQIAREGAFYHFQKPVYDEDFLGVVSAIDTQRESSSEV